MITREIIATCSNPHVARAAVASIGGDFARLFAQRAACAEASSGLYAARLVRAFARGADEQDWEELEEATRGADLPILAGLQFILVRALQLRAEALGKVPTTLPAWAVAPPRVSACWE